MNKFTITMAMLLISSSAAFADTHYHVGVDGMP